MRSRLFYFAFFRLAQYAFMRSACASRCAALRRFRFLASGAAAGVALAANGFLGGLPGRFAAPWSASMARFSLSRSAISRAMMYWVGIEFCGVTR